MSGLRIESDRRRFLDDDAAVGAPAAEPEAPSTRLAAFVEADHADHPTSYPRELFAASGCDAFADAEASVARRADRDAPMRLDGNTSQAERLKNLPRLTQLDGDPRTSQDRQACGVQCVVAALYVQNPSGLGHVAAMELTKNAGKLDAWAGSLGMTPARLRADLEAVRAGAASPRQIATLSEVLLADIRSRVAIDHEGLTADELSVLTRDILAKDSGVPAPAMRLELRKINGGGHFTAEIEVATTADVRENADKDGVVTFDPWPNADGRAPTAITLSHAGAQRIHDGARWEEHTVTADGAVD